MRFRWKLLILLMATSLLPIVAMRTSAMRLLGQFKLNLSDRVGETVVNATRSRLQLTADAYSLLLWKMRDLVDASLLAQVGRVEELLANPRIDPAAVTYLEDFRDTERRPDDALPSPFHYLNGRMGGTQFLSVSYSTPVFKLPPGVDRQSVAADVNRLAQLGDTFAQLSRPLRETVLWQSVSLENGLYCVFPGTDRIPGAFDPRRQEWYIQAVALPGTSWSEPYVDPVTRRIVMSASRPVRRPGGRVAGVTSIAVPVSGLLDHKLLAKNIPAATRSFLCHLMPGANAREPEILILARDEDADFRQRSWRVHLEPQRLTSGDGEELAALTEDVTHERGNLRRMDYQGGDCLWVYGEARNRTFFLLIMPYAEILLPARLAEDLVQERIERLVGTTRYWLAGIVLVSVLLAFAFSRTVTRPVWALMEGARRLAAGDFDTRVTIHSRDEFGVMGQVFNSVGPQLKENRLMRHSLELAMEVQRSLLPPACPRVPGLEIEALCVYCQETGGDYYDFVERKDSPPRSIGVVVGDVTGHGIPSALLMTTARAFLRQRAASTGGMAEVLADVNFQLSQDVSDSGRFVTLIYSELDLDGRTIRWVRAGHDPGLVYDAAEDAFSELGGKGIALGVFPNASFETHQRTIRPGQVIVLSSDGILETHNPQGEMFGRERIKRIVRQTASESARRIAQALIEAAESFRNPLPQEDDITLVVIKVSPVTSASPPPG
jgi:sigma-B regulation protein RsbU (phosphoserine phosphatase)